MANYNGTATAILHALRKSRSEAVQMASEASLPRENVKWFGVGIEEAERICIAHGAHADSARTGH